MHYGHPFPSGRFESVIFAVLFMAAMVILSIIGGQDAIR